MVIASPFFILHKKYFSSIIISFVNYITPSVFTYFFRNSHKYIIHFAIRIN